MTRVMSVKEYKKATVWQQAEQIAQMKHAKAVARKKYDQRRYEVKVLERLAKAKADRLAAQMELELRLMDAQFQASLERLEQLKSGAADRSRLWAVHRYNDRPGVGEQRLLEAASEAWSWDTI